MSDLVRATRFAATRLEDGSAATMITANAPPSARRGQGDAPHHSPRYLERPADAGAAAPSGASIGAGVASAGKSSGSPERRLSGDLVVDAPGGQAALVCRWGCHIRCHSIRGNHEDRHITQLPEDVRNFIVLTVVPPNHPNAAARRSRGKHFEGAIASPSHTENAVKGGFHLVCRKPVSVDLLEIPLDPLELPYSLGLGRGAISA